MYHRLTKNFKLNDAKCDGAWVWIRCIAIVDIVAGNPLFQSAWWWKDDVRSKHLELCFVLIVGIRRVYRILAVQTCLTVILKFDHRKLASHTDVVADRAARERLLDNYAIKCLIFDEHPSWLRIHSQVRSAT